MNPSPYRRGSFSYSTTVDTPVPAWGWPYPYLTVAVPKIRSTYALDPETVQRLEQLARRWGVSKLEVLRRAICAAASASSEVAPDAVSALDELQRALRVSRAKAQTSAARCRAERRAAAARRERTQDDPARHELSHPRAWARLGARSLAAHVADRCHAAQYQRDRLGLSPCAVRWHPDTAELGSRVAGNGCHSRVRMPS